MTHPGQSGLLRPRTEDGHHTVTFIELFFDLVFVFAITQLSHGLLKHFTALGAVETALLLMAVWWVWIFTSWVTNWLDPERTPVRVALLALMLAGLVLSTSIPKAFDTRGLVFAIAFAAMQVGRTLFTLWAIGRSERALTQNFQRILAWLAASAAFWIAGGIASGEARLALWAVALAIEYVSPSLGFWTPGLGRSQTADWNVEGHHLAERCALFIIIALGESILVTGATFSELEWTWPAAAAFAVAFAASVAMWWIYFDSGARRGRENIAASGDPGRLARLAYTYIHLPIVAGIIVSAVADEMLLAHPTGRVEDKLIAATIAGSAIFLLGTALFKRAVTGVLPLSHLAGIVLLVLLVPIARTGMLSPVAFGAAAAFILILVAAVERLAPRRRAPAKNS